MIIKCKIDVKKIDKSKLYVGAKGTYLDITLLENRDGVDQYGNLFMVVQDVSKADREAGVKGAILGNARMADSRGRQTPPPTHKPQPAHAVHAEAGSESDDVPFN